MKWGFDYIELNPHSALPMHRQLYEHLRDLILSGAITGGTKLPSSRILSQKLGVSRATVVTALDQLGAEGYVETAHGSGTFVQAIPKSRLGQASATAQATSSSQPSLSAAASRMLWWDARATTVPLRHLHMSAPDHRLFPTALWARLTKEVFARWDMQPMTYRQNADPSPLEEQIARYVTVSRGINCTPEEVVTTFGGHHAVTLLAELLLDPGDKVAFEEPGMAAIRSIFLSRGCTVVPMWVDAQGANPESLRSQPVKLAFVTAAKQQPLNIAMPAARKLELLHWAADKGALIIEDDLGSEFRYQGRPIPPLKAMDQTGSVIYVGSFSMSLLQTLRVGFMVMPKQLAAHCRKLIQVRYRATPQLTELTVAHFIEDGHFGRHLHRMRQIYARRQRHLLSILERDFGDVFEPPDFAAGFYNVCYFKDQGVDEDAITLRCRDQGFGIEQLSIYYASRQSPRKALLLGFAASDEREIDRSCQMLRAIMSTGRPKRVAAC